MFFFPPYAPKLNPDEQVWNEIKHRNLEKEPIKNSTLAIQAVEAS